MPAADIPEDLRAKDEFHYIDMGFVNRRLCMIALPPEARQRFIECRAPETDHLVRIANDHRLVTLLLDCCEAVSAPTLLKALTLGKPVHLFRSTERLAPCPEIYNEPRVRHPVKLDLDFGRPVVVAYHTSHIVSDTGRMVLSKGAREGCVNSIIGLLHDKPDRFEIEPLVIGRPWFDHWRNGEDSSRLMWFSDSFGEILSEDIDQLSRMSKVEAESAEEWMDGCDAVVV